ncbi:DegT/DnrJ/EryC1/StrS family aminotransferase [Vibrio sp. RE86]|uniref:DegT/DnrJ/EryC1/StrS family aminotransferase n=1 Tax=Vibrio sp. RE86 TaxID=2607605 RepID=UPI0014935A78|nr:DegT/DnrJ/EryC1/StrS family aminotransferase [Vibrio sp. RE86]NOH80823.1 DegT/DnrJ/EryC1/StrS family aminotransferase [Vibrio sp. RE86]
MINVTKSYLPNIDVFKQYVDEIYDSACLTNRGPLHQKLEKLLANRLGVKNLLLVANGTLALQVAYRLLELKGEVITTPFSFAATSSSLIWEGLEPVYADICPNSFNIELENIESAITNRTSAIVPVHVFGNACHVDKISALANKHNLKVIYDASHAFDVSGQHGSLLNYGDISTLSFHATKLFHTIEGGALVINDDELFKKARKMINFGLELGGTISSLGINAKMNEFQAAMGLCMLSEVDSIIEERKKLVEKYKSILIDSVSFQKLNPVFSENYSYFPVVFEHHDIMKKVLKMLEKEGINARRYFFPSLDEIYSQTSIMPVSRDISDRIICLPLYAGLQVTEVIRIASIIKRVLEENK